MADGMDLDALAAKITQALTKAIGGGKVSADIDDDNPPSKVPYHRLRDSREQVRNLTGQLADLQKQVEQLGGGYAAKLKQLQADTADQLGATQKRHAEDLALVDMGFKDNLSRKMVRDAWSEQPKDTRGKGPAEWWQQTTEAHKAHLEDGEKNAAPTVHDMLRGFLPQPESAPTDSKPKTGNNPWVSPEAPKRADKKGIDSVPVDQGMDAFFRGLAEVS